MYQSSLFNAGLKSAFSENKKKNIFHISTGICTYKLMCVFGRYVRDMTVLTTCNGFKALKTFTQTFEHFSLLS